MRKSLFLFLFLFLLGSVSAFDNGDISTNLILYYPLYIGSGTTAFDESGNLLNAVLVANAGWNNTDYKVAGESLMLDGTADRFIVPDNSKLDNLGEFTVAGWIYSFSATTERFQFWQDGMVAVNTGFSGGGTIATIWTPTQHNTICDDSYTQGGWVHLATTYNGTGDGKVRIFINGSECSSYSAQPIINANLSGTNNFSMGCVDGGTSCIQGLMDDVRVYRKALNPTALLELYNSSWGTVKPYISDNNTAPVMREVSIEPDPYAYSFQDLEGYCNATDSGGDNVSFAYRWYRNNILYSERDYYDGSESGQGLKPLGGLPLWSNLNNAFNGDWGGAGATCPSGSSCAVQYNHSLPFGVTQVKYKVSLYIHNDQGAADPEYYFYCGGGTTTTVFVESDELGGGTTIFEGDVPSSCISGDYVEFTLYYQRHGGVETAIFMEENVSFYYYNDEGVEVHVGNLSSSVTSVDDNLSFSCRAFDNTSYSGWLNSSVTLILPNAPEFTYSDVDTGLEDLTLNFDTHVKVNISIVGNVSYENASYSQNKSFTFGGLLPHSFYTLNLTVCNQIDNCSGLGLVGLTKTRINFTAWELISGKSINLFSTNVSFRDFGTNQTNSTTTGLISFVVGNDTHGDYWINGNATSSATNYINLNYSRFNPQFNPFNSTNEIMISTAFYSTLFNVTGFDSVGGEISNFNVTLTSLNYSYSKTLISSANFTSFSLINGSYNVSIEAVGYADNWAVYDVQALAYEVLNFTLLGGGWVYFYFYDEATDTLIADRNTTLEVISAGYATNFSTATGTLGTNLTAGDYTFRFWASEFNERLYYMNILKDGNYSAKLYLLKNTSEDVVTVTLIDQYNDPVEDYTIKLLKYDLVTNSYILRDMKKTNVVGEARVTAELFSEFYKFLVEDDDGSIMLETNPAYITSTTLTLQIITGAEGATNFFNGNHVNYNLVFNEATGNFRVTFSDPNNLIVGACLYLYRLTATNGSSLINSSCISGTAGTILLPAENITGANYKADFYILFDSVEYFVASESYTFSDNPPFGSSGYFFTVLLLIVFAFIGLWKLEVVVILEPVIILIAAMIGFVDVPVSMAFSLVVLGVMIAVIISKGRKG